MYRQGARRQTSMSAFVRSTPGTVHTPVSPGFRDLERSPMDELPTEREALLDESGMIRNARLQTLNIGKAIDKRQKDTVAVLHRGPEIIADLQTRAAELLAQRNKYDDAKAFYRLKGGLLTSLKVPSQTGSACGLRR